MIVGQRVGDRRVGADATNPAVIFNNGFGDHLLNLPALRALASVFEGRLRLICRSGARTSFFSDLPLASAHEVEMRIADGGMQFDADTVARAVSPCDLFLSLNPWHSRSIDRLLGLLAPRRSIGFHAAFTDVLERDFDKHASELAFDVPLQVDAALRLEAFSAPPAVAEEHDIEARLVLASLPRHEGMLVVHADPDEGSRRWPAERWIEVFDRFLDEHPGFLVVIIGMADLGLDRGRHRARVVQHLGLPIPVAGRLVAEGSLFLGVDSCFLHMADLYRVPGVALFGPSDPREWGFRFGPGRHVCGDGSMATIQVGAVLAALASVAKEGRREAPERLAPPARRRAG